MEAGRTCGGLRLPVRATERPVELELGVHRRSQIIWAVGQKGLVEGLSWQREKEEAHGAEAKIVHEVWGGEECLSGFLGAGDATLELV